MKSKKIENIIFDLGGVLLDLDFEKTNLEFSKFGIQNFNELFFYSQNKDFYYNFEKGLVSPYDFRQAVKSELNLNISDDDFDTAWNALLLEYNDKRIALLKELKSKYRTFLLSNTNEIHYHCYSKTLREKHQIEKLEYLFEKAYFSFEMNYRKPETEIYKFVLEQSKLKPERTLFIDDYLENIEAAQKLGIQTFHLTSELVSVF
ncbi:MAG: hypothetical protein A2W98_11050 [Bacteroidetes bacterium GWF2_33_38]|nr:MAG: hypothetical protein A2W98_11050 [Bacteroidetes bacterium GWF2_33_38]OFY91494.1 MAG: hypothetical protein A2236_05065 [Bacteroidetes bacterium RIFOXYA2_FULL_33_7]